MRLTGFFTIILLPVLFVTFQAEAQNSVLESTFISAEGSFPSLHGATLASIPSEGKLLSCWYAGSREMGTDVQIYCSHSSDKEIKWSTPWIAVKAGERHTGDFLKSKSIGNPVLFQDDEAKVTYLFFGTVTLGGWRGVRTFYRISKDAGRTWSESIPVNGSFPGDSIALGRIGKFVRIKPILVSKNEFLLPMYFEWDEKRSFSCSFKRNSKGLFIETDCSAMPGAESLQPSLVVLGNQVHAYTRSKNKFVQHSVLDLNSKTWTPLKNLDIANPDSSIDTAVTDQQGVILVGNILPNGRNQLDLLYSTDGIQFKKIYSFESNKEPSAEYSYPALIKTADGNYHLAFTYQRKAIKHFHFDQAWLNEQIQKAK